MNDQTYFPDVLTDGRVYEAKLEPTVAELQLARVLAQIAQRLAAPIANGGDVVEPAS